MHTTIRPCDRRVKMRLALLTSLALLITCPLLADSATNNELKVSIFYNNDFHGYEPGNLARQAWLVNKARKEGLNVLFLNAGDVFTRGEFHNTFFGELEFAQLNTMGLDAFTLGNNEFKATDRDDTSQKCLFGLIDMANFPVLCANIRFKNDNSLLPKVCEYTIKTINGVKIGILGVTANRVASYGQAFGLKVDDQIGTAKEVFSRLNSESDIQIALTHIGFDQDLILAAAIPNLEVIVGGDSHTLLLQPLPVHGVPIVQAGGEGIQFLGRLDCTFTKTGSEWKLKAFKGSLILLDESVPQDPACKEVYDSFMAQIQ